MESVVSVLGIGATLPVLVSARTRLGNQLSIGPPATAAVLAAQSPDSGLLFQISRSNELSAAVTLQVCLPVNTL